MKDLNQTQQLIRDLEHSLQSSEHELKKMNHDITCDTEYWIDSDFEFVTQYLGSYLENNTKLLSQTRKPKGSVLIILSYNEPLILSVVPVLNAILTGNTVTVRTSSKNGDFFNRIWTSACITSNALSLTHVRWDITELYQNIRHFDAVYFFGGQEHAQAVAAECGKQFVEFFPEIEGADCRVLSEQPANTFDFKHEAEVVLRAAFSHAGQSCQRIHGVLVPRELKKQYIEAIIEKLNDTLFLETHIHTSFHPPSQYVQTVQQQVADAECEKVIHYLDKGFPFIAIEPSTTSTFFKNAYFLPSIWIASYEDSTQLIDILNARTYRLGLSIVSNDTSFVNKVIATTYFSRYTVNSTHIDIKTSEGWGGNRPTGYGGYASWIEHFSNPYTVID